MVASLCFGHRPDDAAATPSTRVISFFSLLAQFNHLKVGTELVKG